MKREEVLSWDGYFMGVAMLTSFRSKDPNTQNGSVIVDKYNRIISVGYNGFPDGCDDDVFPWTSPEKYDFAEHSERNAIYNAGRVGAKTQGATLYLYSEKGYFPCSDCARGIVQAGIKRVVMAAGMKTDAENYSWDGTKRMFMAAGVELIVGLEDVETDDEKTEAVNATYHDDVEPDVAVGLFEFSNSFHNNLKKDIILIMSKLKELGGKFFDIDSV